MLTRAGVRLFSTEALKVVNDVAKQQFVVTLTSDAVIGYESEGKKIVFIHTGVPPMFQGKGVGRVLAKYAFDYAHQNNLVVTCHCNFLAKYYEENRQDYPGLNITFDLENE